MIVRVCAILFLIIPIAMTLRLDAAQSWSLDTYAGQASYKSLAPLVSSSAGVAVRHNEGRREFLAGLGLPLTDNDITWGVVGAGDRFAVRRGRISAAVDAFGLFHVQQDPVLELIGNGLLAEALPTVSYSLGSNLFEARSGPRWYRGSIGEVSWKRMLWTTEFRVANLASERFLFEGDARHDRNRQGEAYTRLGFRAAATLKQIELEGAVGHWVVGVAETKAEWDISAAVPISKNLDIFISAQREDFNPQFLGPPRTGWSAGLTLRIGRPQTLAVPPAFEVRADSRFVIRMPVSDSPATPYIAGDFNGWTPSAMERQGEEWVFPVTLPSGAYRFAFRSAGGEWFVPKSVPGRTEDGMGGWVATLVVP